MLCAGFLMIILDQTIVNVALPSIQRDLHFSQSGLAWVVNAYLIAFGGLLLLVGRLGDLIGRRRIFLAGLALFTAASLLCGVADSQAVLIGARFVQGIGGAMTSAVILGMIVTMFPQPWERAKAIGVYSFVASAGGADRTAGRRRPHADSSTGTGSSSSTFRSASLTAVLAPSPHPRGRGHRPRSTAPTCPARCCSCRSLMLAVYTIVETSSYGWGSAHTLGFGAACRRPAGRLRRPPGDARPIRWSRCACSARGR